MHSLCTLSNMNHFNQFCANRLSEGNNSGVALLSFVRDEVKSLLII